MTAPDRFRFLNLEHRAATASDWNNPTLPKLWLYNLHYFDDLAAGDAADRQGWHLDLIRRWVSQNPPGQGNGWEPYPLSLRIVNWVKWVLAGNELPSEAMHSLAVQARFLRRQLEYHLLGNHLFANAKALVFAGAFFQGREADEWQSCGLKILRAEFSEQILPDGGHFERSPMYHSIALEDVLDLINLFRTYDLEVPPEWEEAQIRMRAWLNAMTHPDGQLALFNDAAFGIAPTFADLEHYAQRLGLNHRIETPHSITRFSETGYIRVVRGAAVLLLDVAPVGPDYIPGHAHADTLTFELSLFGQRVIVDSGTSTYEKNAERQRQRGTAVHNTVAIDGHDSSEVWGGFRVARRARPFGLCIHENPNELRVECAHDGYRRLRGRPVHRREWSVTGNSLQVRDSVEGRFRNAVARYHFHPDLKVELTGVGEGKGTLPGGETFSFTIKKGAARLVNTTYHPGFNVSLPNRCLEVVLDGPVETVTFAWTN